MRSKQDPGERRLQAALADLASALNKTGVPWMVIGGIAIIARGVRRMTADIDAVVREDLTTTTALLRALAGKRIVPRIADVRSVRGGSLVRLLRHEPTEVEVDVSLGWTPFEHEALGARSDAKYGSVVAPMASAEDLVFFKALAARPKDIEDAAALLLMHRNINLDRVRHRLGELAELADEPAMVGGLEAVIARSASVRRQQESAPAKRTDQTPEPAKGPPVRNRKTATARRPKPRTVSAGRKRSTRQR